MVVVKSKMADRSAEGPCSSRIKMCDEGQGSFSWRTDRFTIDQQSPSECCEGGEAVEESIVIESGSTCLTASIHVPSGLNEH